MEDIFGGKKTIATLLFASISVKNHGAKISSLSITAHLRHCFSYKIYGLYFPRQARKRTSRTDKLPLTLLIFVGTSPLG